MASTASPSAATSIGVDSVHEGTSSARKIGRALPPGSPCHARATPSAARRMNHLAPAVRLDAEELRWSVDAHLGRPICANVRARDLNVGVGKVISVAAEDLEGER